MTTITLLEKVYGNCSLKTCEQTLSLPFEGLDVQLKAINKTKRGWLQLEVLGEDKKLALHQLKRKCGFAPVYHNNIRKFLTIRGKIILSKKNCGKLQVDIGVFDPKTCDAIVSLEDLRSQLADGKTIPLKDLVRFFCFYDNLPLTVKILDDSNEGKNYITARLSETQIFQITRWILSSLDRIIIFGVTSYHITQAIERSKLARDIVKVEELGILEHSLLCKLGTDAVGLIPKLGPMFPKANFSAFCPKKIRKLIKDSFYSKYNGLDYIKESVLSV